MKTNSRLAKGVPFETLMTSPKLSVELKSGRFLTGQRISVSLQAKNKTYAKLKSNLATGKNKEGVPLSPNKGCHALANTASPQSQGKKGSQEMSMATCINTSAHSARTTHLVVRHIGHCRLVYYGIAESSFRLIATACKSFLCVVLDVSSLVKTLGNNFLTRGALFQYLMNVSCHVFLRIAEFNTV